MAELVKKGEFERYAFLAAAALLLIVSYFILKGLFVAVISAFVLAFLIKPIHEKLSDRMNRKLAALICIALLVIVIVLPFALIGAALIGEIQNYSNGTTFQQFLDDLFNTFGINIDSATLDMWGKRGLDYLVSLINPLISNFVSFLVQLFVMLFGLYYILIDWEGLAAKLEKYIPFKNRKSVKNELSASTKEIVYGTFLVGLIEFFVALIGFYLLGVNGALLMASLIFIFVFIPGLGPLLVWIPLAIYYLLQGSIGVMVGVVIIGVILSFFIDSVLRNILTGRKSKINPFIMLLGVLGGISVFGIFGFIIGPLILVYTIKFLQEVLARD